eukprot:SM000135S27015  [mRNA]  locus=s135:266587:269301:- [translate_table: standard]
MHPTRAPPEGSDGAASAEHLRGQLQAPRQAEAVGPRRPAADEAPDRTPPPARDGHGQSRQMAIRVEEPPRSLPVPSPLSLPSSPTFPSSPTSQGSAGDQSPTGSAVEAGQRLRTNPFNTGLWVSIELVFTLSQILAACLVLVFSQKEKPEPPLRLWIIGYAAGCMATIPLLFWRYTHRYVRVHGQSGHSRSPSSGQSRSDRTARSGMIPAPATPSSDQFMIAAIPQIRSTSAGESLPISLHNSRLQARRSLSGRTFWNWMVAQYNEQRMMLVVERFKIALDGFFAVWFVVGNVWVFGDDSAYHEAPTLYWLCVSYLTLSCISYAMPFIVCATICCCLPVIIMLLGFSDEPMNGKGASPEAISSLQKYKFRSHGAHKDSFKEEGGESDTEGVGEGGLLAQGTLDERRVSAEDAVCCICLGRYCDGVELKELPCEHHFHSSCVDTWLRINSSCPLCKLDISGNTVEGGASEGSASQEQSSSRAEQARPDV